MNNKRMVEYVQDDEEIPQIKIGPGYQAVIPALMDSTDTNSETDREEECLWVPNDELDDEQLDNYCTDAFRRGVSNQQALYNLMHAQYNFVAAERLLITMEYNPDSLCIGNKLINDLKVEQLQVELKKLNMRHNGAKPRLQEKLKNYLISDAEIIKLTEPVVLTPEDLQPVCKENEEALLEANIQLDYLQQVNEVLLEENIQVEVSTLVPLGWKENKLVEPMLNENMEIEETPDLGSTHMICEDMSVESQCDKEMKNDEGRCQEKESRHDVITIVDDSGDEQSLANNNDEIAAVFTVSDDNEEEDDIITAIQKSMTVKTSASHRSAGISSREPSPDYQPKSKFTIISATPQYRTSKTDSQKSHKKSNTIWPQRTSEGIYQQSPIVQPTDGIFRDRLFCEVCKVWCTSEKNHKQHMTGKHHSFISSLVEYTKPGDMIICDVCKVPCLGRANYNAHIVGTRHKRTVASMKIREWAMSTPGISNDFVGTKKIASQKKMTNPKLPSFFNSAPLSPWNVSSNYWQYNSRKETNESNTKRIWSSANGISDQNHRFRTSTEQFGQIQGNIFTPISSSGNYNGHKEKYHATRNPLFPYQRNSSSNYQRHRLDRLWAR